MDEDKVSYLTIYIKIDPELKEAAVAASKADDLDLSKYIRKLIRADILRRQIPEAIANISSPFLAKPE